MRTLISTVQAATLFLDVFKIWCFLLFLLQFAFMNWNLINLKYQVVSEFLFVLTQTVWRALYAYSDVYIKVGLLEHSSKAWSLPWILLSSPGHNTLEVVCIYISFQSPFTC
jgi:hypothetical protein